MRTEKLSRRRYLMGPLIALSSVSCHRPTADIAAESLGGAAPLASGKDLYFTRNDRDHVVLLVRHLETGNVRTVYSGATWSKLECAPSPHSNRLAIIEWNNSYPGWKQYYWARLMLYDPTTNKLATLVNEGDFPLAPIWIDDDHIGVLLDGVRSAIIEVAHPSKRVVSVVSGYKASVGQLPMDDTKLLRQHCVSIGLLNRLKRLDRVWDELIITRSELHQADPKWRTGALLSKKPSAVLRSAGLLQFPTRWISMPHRHVEDPTIDFSVSPNGKLLAFRDTTQLVACDSKVRIIDTKGKQSPIVCSNGGNGLPHWEAEGRELVYSTRKPYKENEICVWNVRSGISTTLGYGESAWLITITDLHGQSHK